MLPISVCIIAKNEESKIERCLKSLMPYEMEIVLVDTGSSDRTMEIASLYTKNIYSFPWCDDFSAARNFSLQKASYNWILMMDCDEWVEQLDTEELVYFMKHLGNAAGSVTRKNYTGSPEAPSMTMDQTERFFSKRFYHYTGIIHEQLTPKHSKDFECYLLNSSILHDGYLMTPQQRMEKAERNLTLVKRQLDQSPDNPYLYYQLGKAYELTEDFESALYWFGKGLEFDIDPELAYVQSMVIDYGHLLLSSHQLEKALSYQNIYNEFAVSADFVYLMGLIYKECQMYPEAVQEFLKAVTFPNGHREGVNSFLPNFQIAEILILLEDAEGARPYLQKCGNYPPALEALKLLDQLTHAPDSKLTVFVATHVPCNPPEENIYVPLHVGRCQAEDYGYLGDNTGDHISHLNKYYSELTGLYWIWKNYRGSEYVGLCHYRRYFITSQGLPMTRSEYLDLLSSYDIIIAKPSVEPGKTYYETYAEAHHIEDLLSVEKAIASLYPEYLPAYQQIIHGTNIYIGNLFVTSKHLLDAYAEWLFSIFSEASASIHPDSYDSYHRRVYGFLSEQLLFVWIQANHLKWYACPYGFSQEKAEVIQLKQQLFDLIKLHKFNDARLLFLQTLHDRPDITLPASDIKQTLPLLSEIINIGLNNPETIIVQDNDTPETFLNQYQNNKERNSK